MPTFEPPVAFDNPPVLPKGTPGQHPIAYALFRHYGGQPCGQSVLKIGGTYRTIRVPTGDQIASATEVYLGGHIYTITDAQATALTAAGYGAGVS